ncbi:peptide deformylase [Helicobacter saguini]|uniref:Peptide deformylase n=1 Tax=Helicobacter saguini TaxID=1548018 RepID=A0A347VSS8_9HELI|nr:peptide deformylase [Helicobacter saguini]MWV62379.1 peptide deformylase [Helicobacter saguini]MWV66949.1 peptide deformylase [Helicobacter saguini]MWV69297.1 peptide deformylase [Helicobacter saguini]MWV71147.1 peptide deformylase [Helicobacter saguini]TLD94962.1 peptide deformylase [Helicobacter saguini]
MILEVIRYPHKVLRTISQDVGDFDSHLHELLDNMYETMMHKNGVGLAAIQVAKPLRALLINIPREDGEQHKEDLLEIINPVILESSGQITWSEGCLSVPGFYEDIERFNNVKISYFDRLGNACEREFEGFEAVALQHEMDHLNGVLFIDKLPLLKRKKFEKELKKNGYKVV